MTKRPGFREFIGLSQDGSSECIFYLETWRIDKLRRSIAESRFVNLFSAVEVLKDPIRIYKGLRRENQNESYCYIGSPKRYSSEGTITFPNRPGSLFTAFVDRSMTLSDWRWEMEDPDNVGWLVDEQVRFETKIWNR